LFDSVLRRPHDVGGDFARATMKRWSMGIYRWCVVCLLGVVGLNAGCGYKAARVAEEAESNAHAAQTNLTSEKAGKPTTSKTEDPAVNAVQRLERKGMVTRDEEAPAKPVIGVKIVNQELGNDDLKALAALKGVRELDISGTPVTDVGLKELKELTGLQMLNLSSTKISDSGLRELKEFKNLQKLYLANTLVTDAGLKDLNELSTLQTLDLTATKITDSGLKELLGLKSLKYLNLANTKVTNEGVADLKKKLPECVFLR
jgi:hypothetical protein